jgi:hypothetical protein
MKLSSILCLLTPLLTGTFAFGEEVGNSVWKIGYTAQGINAIVSVADSCRANLLSGELGDVLLAYKVKDGIWLKMNAEGRTLHFDEPHKTIRYHDQSIGNVIDLSQTFRLEGDKFHWNIEIVNKSGFPVEIGDLAFAFPWKSRGETPAEIFEQAFTKHAFISGDASFLYFTRYNGEAPFFVMTADTGTKLEYFDISQTDRKYRAYIYSGKSGTAETRGTWRQAHTRTHLQPAGEEGDKLRFGFTFHTAGSYPEIKKHLYDSRLIDIEVVPGMTLPYTQKARFALRTRCVIDSIVAEYPATTSLRPVDKKGADPYMHLYEVSFQRLGENKLTVYFDGGRRTYLEFFSCESPEVLTKKRSAFLVNHQQFRDSSKWYNGLYGVYDMKNGQLRGPDNPDIYDETLTYFLASDDPILGKAPFLASKNVVFPNDDEIASLEYHLEHFVWGKLQRTDKETPYPYGVYGTPNWFMNRNQSLRETYTTYKLDKMRVWRTYDYAHVIMLYWHMYQIASLYPEKSKFMTAEQYLEIAYGTAKAYYTYPTELLGEYYEPFKWGCYNELIIPDLIDELETRGFPEKAAELRTQWEKKAKYFIYDDRYPYRSEYAADRTAFESTYALAKYAVMNEMQADENLWYDPNEGKWYSHPLVTKEKAREFMERQHYANLSCRGYLEKQWFLLGGDFNRSSDGSVHSYMARMGGTSILDYGYRFAADPYEWLRLGYASYLGPFGLVNAGTSEQGYGYWYPGEDKDGAIGQAFTSLKYGRPWILQDEARGPWRYCGEGDLGMCAITRTAATWLVNDPLFGWIVYGGNVSEEAKQFAVYPDDGARIRFRIVAADIRLGLEIDRDNWSATSPLTVQKDLKGLKFQLENTGGNTHTTRLKVEMKGAKSPRLTLNGRPVAATRDRYENYLFELPVEAAANTIALTWK